MRFGWEEPFNVSMLQDGGVLIFCPSQVLADELMEILGEYGVTWTSGGSVVYCSNWDSYCENTYYRIDSKRSMKYGDINSDTVDLFHEYKKCTFYGTQPEEIEEIDPIDEDEWLNLLHASR